MAELLAANGIRLTATEGLARHSRRQGGGSPTTAVAMSSAHLLVESGRPRLRSARAARAASSDLAQLLGLDAGTLHGPRLYDAASAARRRAQDALVEVSRAKRRLRYAGAVRRRVAQDHDFAIGALQRLDGRLQKALDEVGRTQVRLAEADRELVRFHPYGGRLVATLPYRRHLESRCDRARSLLSARETIATRLVGALLRLAAETTALAEKIHHLADTTTPTPPAAMHLIRLALPRADRSDWWRELTSTLFESPPDQQRRHLLSYVTAAPRTIWTSWTLRPRRSGSRDE